MANIEGKTLKLRRLSAIVCSYVCLVYGGLGFQTIPHFLSTTTAAKIITKKTSLQKKNVWRQLIL